MYLKWRYNNVLNKNNFRNVLFVSFLYILTCGIAKLNEDRDHIWQKASIFELEIYKQWPVLKVPVRFRIFPAKFPSEMQSGIW